MYPGIALFYPKLARAVLEYRVGTVDGAKDNAQKQGFKVMMTLTSSQVLQPKTFSFLTLGKKEAVFD